MDFAFFFACPTNKRFSLSKRSFSFQQFNNHIFTFERKSNERAANAIKILSISRVSSSNIFYRNVFYIVSIHHFLTRVMAFYVNVFR